MTSQANEHVARLYDSKPEREWTRLDRSASCCRIWIAAGCWRCCAVRSRRR